MVNTKIKLIIFFAAKDREALYSQEKQDQELTVAQTMNFLLPLTIELLQILKDDAVKVLHSIRQQIWKTQQWPQVWKRSVFIPIPKKGNAKESSNCCTIALISHTSKVMLKILQARLQQYVNHELADVQAGFRKGRGTRDQIVNICWIIKKAKWLSEEALQIAVKRIEAKSKGEK